MKKISLSTGKATTVNWKGYLLLAFIFLSAIMMISNMSGKEVRDGKNREDREDMSKNAGSFSP